MIQLFSEYEGAKDTTRIFGGLTVSQEEMFLLSGGERPYMKELLFRPGDISGSPRVSEMIIQGKGIKEIIKKVIANIFSIQNPQKVPISVPGALGILKKQDRTLDLLKEMLHNTINGIIQGRRLSVNVYMKDIGSRDFQGIIKELINKIPVDKRKCLIFELLEERYGDLSDEVIENIKFLQQKAGFAIAIDDLVVGGDADNNMSQDILSALTNLSQIISNFTQIQDAGRRSL